MSKSKWIPVSDRTVQFPVIGLTPDKKMMVCYGFELFCGRVYGVDGFGSARISAITHYQPAPKVT